MNNTIPYRPTVDRAKSAVLVAQKRLAVLLWFGERVC